MRASFSCYFLGLMCAFCACGVSTDPMEAEVGVGSQAEDSICANPVNNSSSCQDGDPDTGPGGSPTDGRPRCPVKATCDDSIYYNSLLTCNHACGGGCYLDFQCSSSCFCP